jgi:hypothetical protein
MLIFRKPSLRPSDLEIQIEGIVQGSAVSSSLSGQKARVELLSDEYH